MANATIARPSRASKRIIWKVVMPLLFRRARPLLLFRDSWNTIMLTFRSIVDSITTSNSRIDILAKKLWRWTRSTSPANIPVVTDDS